MSLPDFDELVKLAKENPEELERIRQQACEELIEEAPEQFKRKLRGLQFKIDMERRRARTPMASCLKISEMMHDSFGQLRKALKEAQSIKPLTLKSVLNEATDSDAPSNSSAHPNNKQASTEESKQRSAVIEFPATT